MTIVLVLFGLSLAGIIALFALKSWEMRSGRPLAPSLRAQGDELALVIKRRLLQVRVQLEALPPLSVRLLATLVQHSALAAAAAARFVERELHTLADRFSHKHRFERRETNNEFLKQVGEHKNGNGDSGTETV